MRPIRLIEHEAVPECGSFVFRTGSRASTSISRTIRTGAFGPEQLTGEEALEQAKALARAEQDKLEPIRKSHRGCLS
jgi:hypothetical protein